MHSQTRLGDLGSAQTPRSAWLNPRLVLDVAAVIALVVVFGLAPQFYSNELLLLTMLVYIALAQGVNVIYGFTGYLPFGYVGLFGVGAYGASLTTLDWHVPIEVGVLLGGVAAVLVGLALTPLLKLSGAYFAIASLAAAEILLTVIGNPSLTSITKGPYGINLAVAYNSGFSYGAAIVVAALSVGVVVYLRHGRLGLALRAVRDDPVSAEMAGVNVVRERAIAWLISAAIAGLAGGVYAWAISVFYPNAVFSISLTVLAIVFAIFGGVGTVWGPLLGAVVLYGLYNAIGISQPQDFQLIYGILIIVLVLFLPGGIASLGRIVRSRGRTQIRSLGDENG